MKKIVSLTKRSLLVSTALFYMVFSVNVGFSQAVYASETPASDPGAGVTYAPCPDINGTNKPTGSDGWTYALNPATCNWENDYYSWNPVTKVNSARYDQTPILNVLGTAWEYPQWYFSPAGGAYVKSIVSIPVPPQPVSPQSNGGGSSGSGGSNTPAQPGIAGAQSQLTGGSTISGTGYGSSNTLNSGGNTNVNLGLNNNTSVLTSLDSMALTGNAYVTQNTNGGDASTGDAQAVADYLNMIQSSWSPTSGIATFNTGLYGNFTGDLLFNPQSILNTGGSSLNNIANNSDNNLTINSVDNSSIKNNINLGATSGNATVSENTNGGNATTGDSNAVANIINMINSRITSGGGFLGNLNIYGDLNGDLLLPSSILAQLKGTGSNSTNNIANNQNTDVNANVNQNNSITNNLNLNAASGSATVSGNTTGGSANTGSANTNVTQANIVGQSATGNKGLLVFVNVLGKWVGTLWGGSGNASINGTGPDSANNITNNTNTNVDANLTQNNTIENNINIDSKSGDALVSNNTHGGSATSGNATASANILNLINSDVSFKDWFGVLFINVFGNWNGSFGVDTAAGGEKPKPGPGSDAPKPAPQATAPSNQNSNQANSSSSVGRLASSVRSFVASADDGSTTGNSEVASASISGLNNPPAEAVKKLTDAVAPVKNNNNLTSYLVIGGLTLLAIFALNFKKMMLLAAAVRN